LLANDKIGGLGFDGYDSAAYQVGAEINAYATENYSPTARGTELRLISTPNGTVTQIEQAKVSQAGFLEYMAGQSTFSGAQIPTAAWTLANIITQYNAWKNRQAFASTAAFITNSFFDVVALGGVATGIVNGAGYWIRAKWSFTSNTLSQSLGFVLFAGATQIDQRILIERKDPTDNLTLFLEGPFTGSTATIALQLRCNAEGGSTLNISQSRIVIERVS